MSQVKRTKKNREKARRLNRRATEALVAGAAIAAGTQAYAAPVRFNNPPHGEPGHFHWPESGLDVTADAASQPSYYYGPGVFYQFIISSFDYSYL